MDIDTLREMLMLAEKKNYAKAAEQLYISQSALSRHIAAMEAKLGVKLFERSPRQVKLTRYGEALMPFASRIIDLEDDGLKALETVRLREHKAIRIGSILSLSEFGIMSKIAGFIAENSDISLKLIYEENSKLKEMLSTGKADLIIALRDEESEEKDNLKSLKLAEDKLVVVLPKDHPLKDRKEICISDIAGEELILQEDNRFITRIIKEITRKSSIEIKEADIHVAGIGALELVRQGLGITFEQQMIARRHSTDELVLIPLSPERKIRVDLIWQKNISSAGAIFVDYMKKNRSR